MKSSKSKNRFFTFLAIFVFVVFNIFTSLVNTRWDLTSNKIYSISAANDEIIRSNDRPILATLLLGENLPLSFQKLKHESEFFLKNLQSVNRNLSYEVFDPGKGSVEQVNNLRSILAEQNVFPSKLRSADKSEVKEQLIYPFIHFQSGENEVFVNILEAKLPRETEQQAIYRSIRALEQKCSKAIFQLSSGKGNQVAVLAFSELLERTTFEMVNKINLKYPAKIMPPKRLYQKRDSIQVAIVPLSTKDMLSKEDLLYIDQYLVNGGSLIWMIEEYGLQTDSIDKYQSYIPPINDMGIKDFLFKSGVSFTGDWMEDLQSSRIPQVVGQQGGQPQTEMMNFPYHPVIQTRNNHPITLDIKEVNLSFPTIIDTINSYENVSKTVLLSSSDYSRRAKTPKSFSFDFLRQAPNIDLYNQKNLIASILIEGKFHSYFKNRIFSIEGILEQDQQYQATAKKHGKQIVITDRDFALPQIDNKGRALPIGYNKWERNVFHGNEEFLFNSIEFMINGDQFLKGKNDSQITFATLDKKKSVVEKNYWVAFNLLLPSLFLVIIYFLYGYFIKRKYA